MIYISTGCCTGWYAVSRKWNSHLKFCWCEFGKDTVTLRQSRSDEIPVRTTMAFLFEVLQELIGYTTLLYPHTGMLCGLVHSWSGRFASCPVSLILFCELMQSPSLVGEDVLLPHWWDHQHLWKPSAFFSLCDVILLWNYCGFKKINQKLNLTSVWLLRAFCENRKSLLQFLQRRNWEILT